MIITYIETELKTSGMAMDGLHNFLISSLNWNVNIMDGMNSFKGQVNFIYRGY